MLCTEYFTSLPPIKIDQVEKPADSIKVQPPTPIPRATKFKTFLVQQSPEFPVTHTPATTIAQVTNDYHEGEIFVTKDQFEIIDDSSIVILKLDEEQTLRAMLLARSD